LYVFTLFSPLPRHHAATVGGAGIRGGYSATPGSGKRGSERRSSLPFGETPSTRFRPLGLRQRASQGYSHSCNDPATWCARRIRVPAALETLWRSIATCIFDVHSMQRRLDAWDRLMFGSESGDDEYIQVVKDLRLKQQCLISLHLASRTSLASPFRSARLKRSTETHTQAVYGSEFQS